MKSLLLTIFVALLFFSCQQKKEVTMNVTVKDKTPENVNLYQEKADTSVTPDAEGKAVITAVVEEPQYAILNYKWKRVPVYLEPGVDLTANWDMTPAALVVTFEGKGADKNNFINGDELATPVMKDFGLPEDEFLKKMDEYVEDNVKVLESKGFDKDFTEKEKKRIAYDVYGILWQYARRGQVSDTFYEKIKSLMIEEPWLLQLASYGYYMQGSVDVLANKGIDREKMNPHTSTMNQLTYVQENIKDPKIKEFLIGSLACDYIDSEGVDNAEDVKAIFEANVNDSDMKATFNKLYEEGSKITKGKKAVGFKYKDIDGKEVSLDDLQGKFVYIDIWATWCGPCREEIPHLQKLEKAFKGMNVAFVSISIDENKDAWEKMVKSEKLGGIQLHTGGDREFIEAFRVSGIPRFILLDPDGNILEANMSRPSEEKTFEYLSMFAMPEEN